jgi:hypothetical protein
MEELRNRARQAIESLGRRGRTSKIPPAVRAEVLAYALPERTRGIGWREIAKAVGVSSSTIRRWAACEQPRSGKPGSGKPRSGKLVPVTLGMGRGSTEAGPLVLISPAGYRIEGLGRDQALEMLRALR